jgi:hypothetical protein
LTWQKQDHDEQYRRLRHAQQHADIVIDTDNLNPEQVLKTALDYLQSAAS